MNIECLMKKVILGCLILLGLLVLPMIIIGSINTLLEGYINIKHTDINYLAVYVLLVILSIKVEFKIL